EGQVAAVAFAWRREYRRDDREHEREGGVLMRARLLVCGLALVVAVTVACVSATGRAVARPLIVGPPTPRHIETWAYDTSWDQGKHVAATPALVQEWVTDADSYGDLTKAKARRDCTALTIWTHCTSFAYIDTSRMYTCGGCSIIDPSNPPPGEDET